MAEQQYQLMALNPPVEQITLIPATGRITKRVFVCEIVRNFATSREPAGARVFRFKKQDVSKAKEALEILNGEAEAA